MANIFGVNIETPQETQRRLLEEQLAKQKALGPQSAAGQVGSAIGKALSSMFGAEGKQMQAAGKQQEALSMGQKVKSEHLKAGTDPYEAEIMARATAAAHLRALGGAENIALANQMTDSNTQLMLEQKQRAAEMGRIKAQTAQAETATEVNKRRLLEDQSIGELQVEQEHLRARLADATPGPARDAAQKRYDTISGVVEEKKIEGYVPLSGISAESLGLTDEELAALGTENGLPRDTLNTLIQQRRIELEDERLEFARTKLPAGMQIKQDEAITEAYARGAQARSYHQIAQDTATIARMPGMAGDAWRKGLVELGLASDEQNAEIYLQRRINRAVNNAALGNRPPGPLTEKEWEFLKEGEIPTNANNAQIAKVFTDLARLEALEAEYQRQRAQWLDDNRDFRGFQKHWDANRADIEKGIWESITMPSVSADKPRSDVNVGDPVPVDQTAPAAAPTAAPAPAPAPTPAGGVRLPNGQIVYPREQ